jgi:hypothetical protein
VISRIVLLVTAALAFTALAGIPARYLAGDRAFVYCLTAVLLSLVPGVVTFAWTFGSMTRAPQQAPLLALAGSGVRLFGVSLIALLLHLQVPLFRDDSFLFWVLGAYLFLLAAEILILVKTRPRGAVSRPAGPDA